MICIANNCILYMDLTIRLVSKIFKIPSYITLRSLSQRLRKTIVTVKNTYKLSTGCEVDGEKTVTEILSGQDREHSFSQHEPTQAVE